MKKHLTGIVALLLLLSVSSCVKDKYDAPPAQGEDPNITVNFTIDSVIARYNGTNYQFTQDLVICGIITADDKSGNLYKQIIIQDSTGGIAILIDGSSLYTSLPIGRRVFIKLNGLYLTKYKGVPQLFGYVAADGSTGGIPSSLVDKHILKGVWGLSVAPKVKNINQLGPADINTLIQLDGVEFDQADAGQPFADAFNLQSVSRTVKNCNGGQVEAYTSGYAVFANQKTPTGNGRLIAIYSVYNTTGQLIIRDPKDLTMDTTRCGGNATFGNGIAGITSGWGGSDVVIPSGKTITGIVISDKDHSNIDPKNVVIQDSTGGIVVRFTSNNTFAVGDKVTVDLSGLTLSSYNGLIEVLNTPNAVASKIGTGTITPRVATVQDIVNNATAWESTLITVTNATISGSGTTYSGSKTLTDISGNMTLYTRSQATFSGATFPTGTVTVTGVLSDFSGPQLMIRDTTDVQ